MKETTVKIKREKRPGRSHTQWTVMILMPAVLFIVLFIVVYSIVNEQAQSRASMKASEFHTYCSSIFQELQIVGNSLMNDTFFQQCMDAEEFSFSDASQLCQLIGAYKDESSYIKQILVIADSKEHIYSDSAFYTLASLPVFLSEYGISAEVYDDFGLDARLNLGHSTSSFYYYTPVLNSDGVKVASMLITLKNSAFRDIFLTMDVSFCGIFDSLNPNDYICSHIIPASFHLDWTDKASISSFLGEPVTLFSLTDSYDGTENEFTYIIAISRSEYFRPLGIIILCFVIYFAFLLTSHCVWLYRVRKQQNQDISALITELPKQYSNSSYHSVYENIRLALKDYRKMQENSVSSLQTAALQGILRGYYGDNISQTLLETAGLDSACSIHVVVGFYILETPSENIQLEFSALPERLVQPYFIMIQTALKTLADLAALRFSCSSNTYYNSLTVVFSSTDSSGFEENVTRISSELTEMFRRNYGLVLQAAVSEAVTDFSKLEDAYSQVMSLHSFARATANAEPLICHNQFLAPDNHLSYEGFLQREQILLNVLIAQKYEVVPELVSSILSSFVSYPTDSYHLTTERMNSLRNILLDGVYASGCQRDLDPASIEKLRSAKSIPDLTVAVNELFGQMAALTTASVTDATALACQYIAANITNENLSVNEIAEASNVSVRHLTALFKARFSMTIADYVNYQRITMAKEYLRDSKSNVATIAKKVGYYSADTFTRNFRKLEGITPTEFRNLMYYNKA